jgi:hypothetical protein
LAEIFNDQRKRGGGSMMPMMAAKFLLGESIGQTPLYRSFFGVLLVVTQRVKYTEWNFAYSAFLRWLCG